MPWLIEQSFFDRLESLDESKVEFTPEQEAIFQEQFEARSSMFSPVDSGDTARIRVEGILKDQPNFMHAMMGIPQTTYRGIRAQIEAAESDPMIKQIEMLINSPGGTASAEFQETVQAIANTRKPIHAFVGDMAASAAYGLASQADSITAQNRYSKVGSIGVIYSSMKNNHMVQVTSSNAPLKKIDASTDEGKVQIREFIDQLESQFIESIADGRGVSTDTVKKDFGRGGLVLAADAKKRGMIDEISSVSIEARCSDHKIKAEAKTTALSGNQKEEIKTMTLDQLKAEHPSVFAAAVEAGINQERERIQAHLTLGDASGDMETAMQAINDGSQMTPLIQAKYQAAAMRKAQITARNADEDTADAADTTAEPKTSAETEANAVIDAVCAHLEGK